MESLFIVIINRIGIEQTDIKVKQDVNRYSNKSRYYSPISFSEAVAGSIATSWIVLALTW